MKLMRGCESQWRVIDINVEAEIAWVAGLQGPVADTLYRQQVLGMLPHFKKNIYPSVSDAKKAVEASKNHMALRFCTGAAGNFANAVLEVLEDVRRGKAPKSKACFDISPWMQKVGEAVLGFLVVTLIEGSRSKTLRGAQAVEFVTKALDEDFAAKILRNEMSYIDQFQYYVYLLGNHHQVVYAEVSRRAADNRLADEILAEASIPAPKKKKETPSSSKPSLAASNKKATASAKARGAQAKSKSKEAPKKKDKFKAAGW
jgi:hypothetical protein